MSPARQRPRLTTEQEPFLVARTYTGVFHSGYEIDEHAHPWRQLLHATSGAMTVTAESWTWLVTPGKAVLIPADRRHSIRMWGEATVQSLYFPPELASETLACDDCRVLTVTPLLRELILRVIDVAALDSRVEAHARLLAVLLDEIRDAPDTPLLLPMPGDARAGAIARHVLADPTAADDLETLGRKFGASRRTAERLFRAETGLSFGLWRQKARLLTAARLLAEGRSVTNAGMDAGYSSVSAFIVAFKHAFGCTPGRL
jgi:AraC-like DNA-binding protein